MWRFWKTYLQNDIYHKKYRANSSNSPVHVRKSYLASRIKRFLKNPDKLEKLILTFCDQRRSSTYTGYITFVNILSNIVKGTAETIDNISWYPGMLRTVCRPNCRF